MAPTGTSPSAAALRASALSFLAAFSRLTLAFLAANSIPLSYSVLSLAILSALALASALSLACLTLSA